jgi:hypothetical protein
VRFVAMSGVWWRKRINRRGAAARTRSDGARKERRQREVNGWSGRGRWAALCLVGRFFFLFITSTYYCNKVGGFRRAT